MWVARDYAPSASNPPTVEEMMASLAALDKASNGG